MSRRKRKRIPDKRNCGESSLVPFDANETWKERHARRLESAHSMRSWLADWCKDKGLDLAVKNFGHHWIFTAENFRCEWWPSSAKFVCGDKHKHNRFRKGIHCHDVQQLTQLIEEKRQ